MNTRDNIQAELQRMSMEIVRLTNEKVSQEEYVRFLESENRTIEEETRRECLQQVELANLERDNALKRAVEAENGRKKSDAKAANLQLLLDETTLALSESNKKVTILTEKVRSIDDLKDVLEAMDKAALDAKQVIELINRRVFQRNSDATRFLNNEIDPCCPLLEEQGLFLQEDDQSPEARLEFRKKWSEQIVNRLMNMLRKFRAAGDEYGQMVHRAVNYILDDEDAFRTFLQDGRIDMHNIAIERCFRHIAMGRRNWQQAGSHFAAKSISFMFGLLESCKLNKVNFGEYIEDVLTRILFGEEVDESFLPCDYVRRYEDGKDAELPQHAA